MLPSHFTDLDNELAVGSFPEGAECLRSLFDDAGIRAVVNLQSDDDLLERGIDWLAFAQDYGRLDIAVSRIPIIDFVPKDLLRNLTAAVAALANHIEAGRKVYVHCNAGLNRSPTTILGYLVMHRHMGVAQGSAWLEERHDCVLYDDVVEVWARSLVHAPSKS